MDEYFGHSATSPGLNAASPSSDQLPSPVLNEASSFEHIGSEPQSSSKEVDLAASPPFERLPSPALNDNLSFEDVEDAGPSTPDLYNLVETMSSTSRSSDSVEGPSPRRTARADRLRSPAPVWWRAERNGPGAAVEEELSNEGYLADIDTDAGATSLACEMPPLERMKSAFASNLVRCLL